MCGRLYYFLFLLFTVCLFAQKDDLNKKYDVNKSLNVNYKNRWVNQQNYIVGYMQEHKSWEKPFKNTSEVDSLISLLSDGWCKEGITDSVNKRFDIYPLVLVTSISGYAEWVWNYTLKKYMIPNFLQDVKFMMKDSQLQSVYLINAPSYMNLISSVLSRDIEKNVWNEVYKSINLVGQLIDSSLIKKDFDISFNDDFQKFKTNLLQSKPRFELLDAIYNGNLNNAFTILSTSFSNGSVTKNYLIRPSKLLVNLYNDSNQKDQAIETLKLLSKFTIEEELERDSLRALYNKTDREKGDSIFYSFQNVKKKSSFITSKEKMLLKGKYLNLTTSQKVDLSSFTNKYILFDFWFTACGPCRKEIPSLIDFYSQNKTNKDFVFISIVSDAVNKIGTTKSDIIKFIKDNKIEYIVLYDTKTNSLTKKFDVNGFPTKYLINNEGHFLERNPGDKMASIDYAKALIKELSEK